MGSRQLEQRGAGRLMPDNAHGIGSLTRQHHPG